MQATTQVLGLFDRSVAVDQERTTVDHITFTICLPDYDSERKRLETLGLNVEVKEHEWVNWRSLYFHDPEGNQIELVCYDENLSGPSRPSDVGITLILHRFIQNPWCDGFELREGWRSGIDKNFESAVSHPLEIKGRIGRITHLLDSKIGHYFRVDLVAGLTGLENDPGEKHRLIRFRPGQVGERHLICHLEVIANAFPKFQSAVFLPYPAGLSDTDR